MSSEKPYSATERSLDPVGYGETIPAMVSDEGILPFMRDNDFQETPELATVERTLSTSEGDKASGRIACVSTEQAVDKHEHVEADAAQSTILKAIQLEIESIETIAVKEKNRRTEDPGTTGHSDDGEEEHTSMSSESSTHSIGINSPVEQIRHTIGELDVTREATLAGLLPHRPAFLSKICQC